MNEMSVLSRYTDEDPATPAFAFGGYPPEHLAALKGEFSAASPFPHLVIDDFLSLPSAAVTPVIPDPSWPNWNKFRDAYQQGKRTCSNIDVMPALLQRMIHELSGPAFLGFLETVTGIRGLIPDPYLAGGGLHSSGPGGILTPHADFHSYGRLALYRKLNVLVYLNPGWRAEDGGSLELFRKGDTTPTVSVVPEYGRMVLFLTDDKSIHGFTQPVAGPAWRNSIALYFYTSEDDAGYKGDGVTYWQSHGKQAGMDRVRLLAFKVLQRASSSISNIAHHVNPNLKHKPVGSDHHHHGDE